MEAGNYCGIVGADEIAQHLRPTGGQPATGAEDVLVRDRDAGQRTAFAPGQARVGGVCLGKTAGRIDGDVSVELRVVAGNAFEVELGQFDARNLLVRQGGRHRLEAVLYHSMTFGTR
ncbi:MAG: hypothetical protein AW09_003566 [Candidatus Accumulibacter phosphatis]|uniref:Uncharacterized protein n=1 Tax=Candidatus Accumulibacter phosphatis TaxID=327160 RepID=A0A080LSF3_9PROT|nr:MAG: hypothetical protein AW09_003566 [Candidatus Accumulibacter phosphatis]